MTESRNGEPDRGARWSDKLRARLDAARDSEAQRAWSRWEAAALKELSRASLDEVSWALAEGVRLPPLVDLAIEGILPPALERSAARGVWVREPRRPWDVLRTRNGLHPDLSVDRSAWEQRLGVTRISVDATHVDVAGLDPAKWSSVIAAGLSKELRVGSWSSALAAWSEVVVDPVAAVLATGGDSAGLEPARAEAMHGPKERLRFGVDVRAVHEAGGDPVDEVAVVLAQIAAWLRVAARRGTPLDDVFTRLDVSVAIGREPLVEIAKLRALRGAIAALVAACGASSDRSRPRVSGHSSHRELTGRDPWVNLLRGTMVGVAGVLGGVDALEIAPLDLLDDVHGEFGARMAIDTHRLLRDEAHLAVTTDPTGGSHAIEAATEALASAAWGGFREIEGAGGFDAWLAAGRLHRLLGQRAASLASRVRDGSLVLLGSNLHPPKDVHAVPKGGWISPATRSALVQVAGDIQPIEKISLESMILASPSSDAVASHHGVA